MKLLQSNLALPDTLSWLKEQQDEFIDLSALIAQGKVNKKTHSKGLLFKFRWITPDVMEASIRGYAVALYVKSLQRTYRVEGSLEMHWRLVKRAIEQSCDHAA